MTRPSTLRRHWLLPVLVTCATISPVAAMDCPSLEMPAFPKRRFQHGSVGVEHVSRYFPHSETRYRRHFETLHAAVV